MLQEYKEAIEQLVELQDKYDKLDILSSTASRDKRRTKRKITELEDEIQDMRDEVRKKILEEKEAAFSSLKDEANSEKTKASALEEERDSKIANISLDEFNRAKAFEFEIINTLNDTYDYLNSNVPDIVARESYDIETCINELDKLANKCGRDYLCKPVKSRVLQLLDIESEEESNTSLDEVLEKIVSIPKSVDQESTTKYKVFIYGSFVAVGCLAFYNLSFLLLGGIGIGLKIIYDKRLEQEALKKIRTYLEDFKSMYIDLGKYLLTESDRFEQNEIEKVKESYAEIIEQHLDRKKELLREYKENIKGIKVKNEEIDARTSSEFNSKLEELQEELAKHEERIRMAKEGKIECDKALDSVQDKISELRDKISEVYWQLSSVGSEKLLMKEFFLGFKEYDLISVKHDGHAMAIIYDGESSERNSVLISMFIAQLFSNMIPNVLNISIADCDYTCRDYAIYNGEYLELIFNFLTTKEQITSTINDLHSDLLIRQSEISPYADSIEDFNKAMIEKNSFTKDYRLFISQNTTEDVLGNQKMVQLCRNGKTFGILPILFISKSVYQSIINGDNDDVAECKEVLDSVKDYTWLFRQESLDLEKITPPR